MTDIIYVMKMKLRIEKKNEKKKKGSERDCEMKRLSFFFSLHSRKAKRRYVPN